MLWLRWYITHSEPVSVITTSTRVKISASMFQPPSRLGVHVQEVDHVDDDLHGREAHDDEGRDARACSSTLPITSQNGIAVRITDSTKPVR